MRCAEGCIAVTADEAFNSLFLCVHAHQAKKKIKLLASVKTALTEREEGSLGQA